MINRYIRGIGLIKSDSSGYYLYNTHEDVVQLSYTIGNLLRNYEYDAFGNQKEADCLYYFNGNNNVELGTSSDLKPTEDITIAMWVNPLDIQNTYADIISCHGTKVLL